MFIFFLNQKNLYQLVKILRVPIPILSNRRDLYYDCFHQQRILYVIFENFTS